jgi:hypothetical protein
VRSPEWARVGEKRRSDARQRDPTAQNDVEVREMARGRTKMAPRFAEWCREIPERSRDAQNEPRTLRVGAKRTTMTKGPTKSPAGPTKMLARVSATTMW